MLAGREAVMSKYISLTTWADEYYDDPPTPGTLRRWARNGNIFPPPEIHGREYRVSPDAFYIKPNKCGMKLVQHHPNGRTGRRSPLLEKLINESEKKLQR
ncbi:excisionase [Pantoea sp. Bo_2]|nr:excisionase [Pantoea sp. VH_3]KAA5948609.1 excisionase [Pantoea sp. VH_25]KAA5955435.1 excisionase [Pantoea sp. VH_24]KAA5958944.1 excisionase [Pantoea sp. VH_16]KAA5964142.1 excisionase [Pantoea sp. VH_18]KAA5981829.1 excisionase [Pantoea sp. M_3]KAA5993010.1 excisionase [Pantoea sp. M_1]KAA6002408.1 excisionase [Pantoea sp. F_7]KAA6010328.1 excisionase [Pantoea sp. F_18]KAA6012631.1 excisionase [Pantoea sp. F_5]KAA6015377.1 excisionase [Pantoea sp. F_15]KAA6023497.1 excisionase [Pan